MTYKTIMVIAELLERETAQAKGRLEFSMDQIRKFREKKNIGDWQEPEDEETAREYNKLKDEYSFAREEAAKYGMAMDDFEVHEWK